MWQWDQGRLPYFQYDVLRAVSRFVISRDMRNTPSLVIREETGLEFLPSDYAPWRNYARTFKLGLLVSEVGQVAVPTDVARLLAQTGSVTCDEYMHFLAQATTSPSPALSGWNSLREPRFPLCFSLRYILAKMAVSNDYFTPIDEIIGAYASSGFRGGESDEDFLRLISNRGQYLDIGRRSDAVLRRQARESIKVLCQISYLHNEGETIIGSLSPEDAGSIFQEITPIEGISVANGDEEIQRRATLFRGGSEHDFFDYQTTTVSNEIESGFLEVSRVKRSHTVIERNSRLRTLFFDKHPGAVCDACLTDTRVKYPWTVRVLDMHHILPLSSGTQVHATQGTLLGDLVAICPTCHRAVHRFYDQYLREVDQRDFMDLEESRRVYSLAKTGIRG